MRRWLWLLILISLGACNAPHEIGAAEKSVALPMQEGLVLDPPELDLGQAREGEKVHATLLIRNNGSGFAQIASIETSCGCTTAEPGTRMLAPGAFTRLSVEVDTFGKRGKTRKWIKVIDGMGREATAWLTLTTLGNPHLQAKGRTLFDGKCASCHYQPAVGLTSGAAIYKAVCAMCHGAGAKGAYAPELTRFRDAALLKQKVALGNGTTHMPAFARKAGGPLDEKQLDALVQWLLSLDEH
jgi:mono/diheme cytochrome c family protein